MSEPLQFWLGAPPNFLGGLNVRLMVGHGRLRTVRRLHRAVAPVWIDSRGFSELAQHGHYTFTPEEYIDACERYVDQIGTVAHISQMDHMCEPGILAKTGRTIEQHQDASVTNYLRLVELAPELPWVPAVQGWLPIHYLRHVRLLCQAGVNLRALPVVAVGTLCREQHRARVAAIINELAPLGLRLHGFGVKTDGLRVYGQQLASADSWAWSYHARKNRLRCRHPGRIEHEANCPDYASEWRARVLAYEVGNVQLALPMHSGEAA